MPHTQSTFHHLGIAPKLLGILDRLKFITPTPIQSRAIPSGLEGQDIVGIAQTGTGKTLAFGIPLVQRVMATGGGALVLVPTRELAQQVSEVFQQIVRPFGLTTVVIIGGASMGAQIQALRKKPKVIIATPGRLNDLLGQRAADLSRVNLLVLDEADRMFDMGFAPQVHQILRQIPRERQTMLFSATMPQDIVRLATSCMKLPIQVEIAPSGTAAEHVSQEVYIVREESKKTLLGLLLAQYRGSILIFTRTRIKARRITRAIYEMHHKAAEIHSDRSMAQRREAIEGFKNGRFRILVATDIAARGIDVKNIEVVINYDLPEDPENYVHRIGRTGRAGLEGLAISFATPDQASELAAIERLTQKPIRIGRHPEFPEEQLYRPVRGASKGGRVRSFGRLRRGRRR